MISIEQLNGEISILEDEIPTHVIMQKLANLYTIRDHMSIGKTKPEQEELYTSYGDTEFLTAIKGKDLRSLMLKLDELMTTIYVLNPRLYQNAIDEIKRL